jgi:SAM-dependent methyltransferase
MTMHASSYNEMAHVLHHYLRDRRGEELRIADVGSRAVNVAYPHTYRDLMPPLWDYVGFDTEVGRNVDVEMADAYEIPVDDGVFDIVLSGQCLEHVQNPFRLVAEMARVVKEGGLLILTAPWQWEIHPYPLDCWRILPDGMRALCGEVGMTCLEAYTRDNDCWGIFVKRITERS